MSFELGTDAVLKIADSGETLQDVSAYLTSDGLAQEVEAVEATHFGDTARKYVPGLEDASVSLEGDFDPVPDANLSGIKRVRDVAWEYHPQGEGTGLPVYSGVGMLTSYEITAEPGELGKFSSEFQVSGGATRDVNP
jgi:hypothetical protein